MEKNKIIVSGSSGFIGQALVARLLAEQRKVHAFVRNPRFIDSEKVAATSLLKPEDWLSVMQQCSVFIHCAARAHCSEGYGTTALAEFRKANTGLTMMLARQAAMAGVRRFIFLSSIGVNGIDSGTTPFRPNDPVNPQTPYAVSKYEAELGLHEIAQQFGLEVVIIRPPLVYGVGAPGNFAALLRLARRGWPLPLAAINQNKRSFVAIDNLIDLIVTCIEHPAAAGQTLLVSDGEDVSTAELVQQLRWALGQPARLFAVPMKYLEWGARLVNKPELFQSLCGSLQVDIADTQRLLGWQPTISIKEGLKRAVGSE